MDSSNARGNTVQEKMEYVAHFCTVDAMGVVIGVALLQRRRRMVNPRSGTTERCFRLEENDLRGAIEEADLRQVHHRMPHTSVENIDGCWVEGAGEEGQRK
jgi:hypothetical protein